MYFVCCTHQLKEMKLRFPWNMALLECSWVFIELSQSCVEASPPVFPPLQMWQWALDQQLMLPLPIPEFISRHTLRSPWLIWLCSVHGTRSICILKHVVHIFEGPSWLSLTKDSLHAEVVHFVWLVDIKSFSSQHLFNHRGKVVHHLH